MQRLLLIVWVVTGVAVTFQNLGFNVMSFLIAILITGLLSLLYVYAR